MENNIKGTKVYLLMGEWVNEGETGSFAEVFVSENDAIEEFAKQVKQERECDHLYDSEDVVEEFDDERHTFCIYEDGRYCEDHFEMHIETKIIH